MPIRTRRWNDPAEPGDGYRVLICRYRPRGVAKSAETWDLWEPHLGPSKALHAAMYADNASKLPWTTYRRRYLDEMRSQQPLIAAIARRVASGETITLLCSSACERDSRCHRSLLRELVEAEVARGDLADHTVSK
jgi:uncharacterized protein YeaO (DUF488 family)